MKPELQKIFTKLSEEKLEKVELATINEVIKSLNQLETEIKGEGRLYESFKKTYYDVAELSSEIISLQAKKDKLIKPYKNIIPQIKKKLSELTKELNKTESDAKTTIAKMKDLGIENKDIDLRKIEILKNEIKKLDFNFLNELPF
jgi:hypothetical protein